MTDTGAAYRYIGAVNRAGSIFPSSHYEGVISLDNFTLIECDSCGRYFPEKENGEYNYVTSENFPKSRFCSVGCRNEAEWAAEDNRRTDVRPGSY